MFKFLKSDAVSGFLVFLIALPLCLGIAKASGFPPIAGIYTAVIGGLVVTFLSNSALTIKGPAAGLIAIAVAAVDELGGDDHIQGYKLTLAVVVISGLLQVILGLVKSGKLSDFFPASVIHGMLAAIGVIIMSKQIHIAIGVVPEGREPFELIKEIPISLTKMNPEVAFIGLVSILILFLHPLIKQKTIKRLPAPLLVLAVAIPLGFYFDLSHEHDYNLGDLNYHINPSQLLVALPDNFFSGFTFPDFSEIFSRTSIKYIIMFALVGSIESLLSAKAIDTLDPEHRKTNMNQDLVAIGIGNTIAGFVGGLPMISEIVRSSANINNGAQSKWSNFFHGLYLFLFAFFAAFLIQKIPNAALSAMLVYTGYRLASPVEFKKVKEIGYDQLFFFIVTLVVTLISDLLVGVAMGIIAKMVLQVMQGCRFKELFGLRWVRDLEKSPLKIDLIGIANFITFLKFKNLLESIPKNGSYTLDFSHVKLIDHTFIENLYHQQLDFVQEGGNLTLTGFENHNFMSNDVKAARKKMLNPFRSNSLETLSKRGKKFSDMSKEFGCDFEMAVRPSVIRPYLSPFSIIKRFKTAKKIIICNYKRFNLILADIEYQNIGDFTEQKDIATILVINNIDVASIPEFFLERSSLIRDMSTRFGFNSFDFDKLPDFDVYCKDQESLNHFLTDELLSLINDSNYTIESRRGSILIHRDLTLISSINIPEMMSFANKFANSMMEK